MPACMEQNQQSKECDKKEVIDTMKQKAFITNTDVKTLKKRLEQLIEHSEELKFLVGFFYFSGWQQLYDSLKDREDIIIKVLVGLEVDNILGKTVEVIEENENQTNEDKAERFFTSICKALNTEEMDVESFFQQVEYFVRLIGTDRLFIRKTLEPNHAKLYIFKAKKELMGWGGSRFITGSSNLTRAGILEQNEFNVEISDYGTEDAEKYFDALWELAIPITEREDRKKYLIELINDQTQAAAVSPYEAFLYVLKTYIELQEQKKVKPQVVTILEQKGYTNYEYQRDAVSQALTILENYNGVIIADVVGLGKSVIAGMVAKHLNKRGMIICPPSLMGDKNAKTGWMRYRNDFQLYDWEIRSCGDLEGITQYFQEHGEDIEVVIIDEVHRFRNQDTQDYEYLNMICRNRRVIMLTATPFNNSPADIFSLLKLFVIPGKSKVTLDDDLESRFRSYDFLFRRLSFITKNYKSKNPDKRKRADNYYETLFGDLPVNISKVKNRAKRLAAQIRGVLEPILIRRNRIDLKNDLKYSKEVAQLSETENPRELFFELSPEQSAFYDQIINDYFVEEGRFRGAIYQPFTYEKKINGDKLSEKDSFTYYQQKNLYDFMRRLLVKRFESSFGAFCQSIKNFIRIHECVLEFIANSNGRYILDRKLVEKIYDNDIDEIEKALEEFAKKLKEEKRPKSDRIYIVDKFEDKNGFFNDINSDLTLFKEIQTQVDELALIPSDPKADELVKSIRKILNEKPEKGEPIRRVIIFTEYVDTVIYLQPILEREFPGEVLSVPGILSGEKVNQLFSNFDASVKKKDQKDEFTILLTSDKLSEGLDLNRAGAVINCDIPWNPTRVIQRLGRINRIGTKVFDRLRIYNFFPTEKGADIVKSRQIASDKMFLIHNTLGEDAKIFDVDEEPSASELFKRINANPEDEEEESLLTRIRRIYNKALKEHPEVIDRISKFPPRTKTAKEFERDILTVFRRKRLGLFIQSIDSPEGEKQEVQSLLFEEALSLIECDFNEKRLTLSERFWPWYERVKKYRDMFNPGKSEISLEIKAQNNLQSALRFFKEELKEELPFIRMLISDLREYKTLPKYSLRRLTNNELKEKDDSELKSFKKEVGQLKEYLGENYLDDIKRNIGLLKSEIIIAVENIKIGK